MRPALALFAISSCMGMLLAGCSDSQAGVAQPVDTTRTGEGTTSKAPSPTTSSASSPLDAIDPCELLSDAERAQLKLEPGKPSKAGRSRACDWNSTGEGGVGVNFKVDLAFKDANLRGATPTRVDIGRHEAYEVRNAGGSRGVCEIFIVTGESSFVQVTGVKGLDSGAAACELAAPLAKIIDPKLP